MAMNVKLCGGFTLSMLVMSFIYSTVYAVVSRLPMIYAMVHMLYVLEVDAFHALLVFAGYCIARLLAAFLTSAFFGIPAMALGTLCGVIAHVGILAFPEEAAIYGPMVVLSGFTETVTGIDTCLKIEALVEDLLLPQEQMLFRLHMGAATLGTIVAYYGGGIIFEQKGINGVGWLGLISSAFGLLLLGWYAILRPEISMKMLVSPDDVLNLCEAAEAKAIAAQEVEPVSIVPEAKETNGSTADGHIVREWQYSPSPHSSPRGGASPSPLPGDEKPKADEQRSEAASSEKTRQESKNTSFASFFGANPVYDRRVTQTGCKAGGSTRRRSSFVQHMNAGGRRSGLMNMEGSGGGRASARVSAVLFGDGGKPGRKSLDQFLAEASMEADEEGTEEEPEGEADPVVEVEHEAPAHVIVTTDMKHPNFIGCEDTDADFELVAVHTTVTGGGKPEPKQGWQEAGDDGKAVVGRRASGASAGSSKSLQSSKSVRSQMSYCDMEPKDQKVVLMKMWSVVVSYYVTPFPIGMNFAINTLFWLDEWNKGTEFSGLLMAIGEFSGMSVLLCMMNKRFFESSLTQPFKKPMNLVLSTIVASMMVLGVPIFRPHDRLHLVISAFFAQGIHIINVLLHSFCTEAATAWAPRDVYAMWMGRCYVAKRASNATMAFLCISLYKGVGPQAPYFVIGSIVFTWGFVLFGLYFYLGLLPFQQKKGTKATRDSGNRPSVVGL